MNEITDLREIQQVELGILRHLDQVCWENGLHFFLQRHPSGRREIPKVHSLGRRHRREFMPRCDYDRLMRLSGADSAVSPAVAGAHPPGGAALAAV